jgi:two-component system, NtrC family, C4-dicarboxylate transport response regulator DctD
MTRCVLLVDDDAAVREALAQTLELADIRPITAGSFVAAKDRITPAFEGVILSDIRMPGRDGFHLLDYAHAQDPDLPVILLTGEGDIPMAVAAMGQGAFGFLEKPCAPADLLAVLERALKTRDLVLENRRLRQLVETGDPAARMIFGSSELAQGLRRRVRLAAQARGAVLVTGAPGTGISKVAEVIHLSSPRSKAPFVKRAGGGLTEAGLAAALEEATGGSLFIDEIAQLAPQLQLTLSTAVDDLRHARLIAGNTRDLGAEMTAGRFSADLYYRLEVLSVRIPALSERPEDIPVMFRRYVDQAAEQAGLTPPEVTPEVVAGLMARDWPGNARALMSVAMRFVMGLPEDMAPDARLGLADQMAQVEQSLLEAALRRAGGQASAAAEALRLPRKTFYDKCARYGIRPEDFRGQAD